MDAMVRRCLWIGKPTALNAMGNFLVGFIGIAAFYNSNTRASASLLLRRAAIRAVFSCLHIKIL